nr:hypothetical protein [Tanacetum cinerariifolium]
MYNLGVISNDGTRLDIHEGPLGNLIAGDDENATNPPPVPPTPQAAYTISTIKLLILKKGVSTEDANQKCLRSLPFSWSHVSLIMRTKLGVDTLSFDDLYNNLRVFEYDVKGSTASSPCTKNVTFISSDSTNSTNEVSTAYDHEDAKKVDEFDLEEMDLKWQVAMISTRLKKFYKKTGRKLHFDAKEQVGFDKTKVECFNCHSTGHFAREECVDWTSHDEDDTENYALMTFNSSNSGSDTKNNPHQTLKGKGIVDSGCSRHMTRNKAYLVEYQDFNDSLVAFEGSKGQITSKVLLRVPRQKNMYSFNLENIVPSRDLACLIAKATVDESNKWHSRMTTPVLLVIKESNTRPPPITTKNKANKTAGPKEANNNVGTQDNIDAGHYEIEAEHVQEYCVLPLWPSYTSTVKSSEAKNKDEKLIGDTGAARDSSTNYVNTASTPFNTASTPVNTASPSRHIPSLKDIYEVPNDRIFTSASYDDEGAVADFTNLESTMNISRSSALREIREIQRHGHYWPTVLEDYIAHAKSYDACQRKSCCNSRLMKFGFWLTCLLGRRGGKRAKTGTNIEEGTNHVVNEGSYTDKVKVINAEAEGISVAGETLNAATLTFTMSNRHKEFASPKANSFCKELASLKQTALGKDFSNPLMADILPKTIWLSMHHVIAMKHWLFQSKWILRNIKSVYGRDFCDRDMSFIDIIPKKVVKNFDVFSLRVLYRVLAKVANAARNYEILHERDDEDTERPDKRQGVVIGISRSSHRSHGHNNDHHGSDRRGGSDNHRSSNKNYSGSNN